MGMGLRIFLLGWALVMLGGCQYADLDNLPEEQQVDAAPAYQVYLRPSYLPPLADPPDDRPLPTERIEQLIVIRNRLNGKQRVVDAVQPVARMQDVNTRMLTFGRFSSPPASGVLSGGEARITEAQNRRLLYLKGGTALSGGQLWELQLDSLAAPRRRLSLNSNICTIFDPIYDFSAIENTVVPFALPGPRKGNCSDNDERPLRQVRLDFAEDERPIFLGNSFRRIGRPLNVNGSVIRQLVDVEFNDKVQRSDFTSCPFFLNEIAECTAIMRFDNLDGCRRRDGCVIRPGGACQLADEDGDGVDNPVRKCKSNTAICPLGSTTCRDDDLSVRTLPGPAYRLSNQLFRVGSVEAGIGIPSQGDLALYVDNQDGEPAFTKFHGFSSRFRRNGFLNREDVSETEPVVEEVTISQSPNLRSTTAVVEASDSDTPDLVFFSDGNKLYRTRITASDPPARFAIEPPQQIFPAPGAKDPRGELLDIRRLGNEIVFRWCGPVKVGADCRPGRVDAICELRLDSCPQDEHEREQALYSIPMENGRELELDRIKGGSLAFSVTTSTAITYNAVMTGNDEGVKLPGSDVQREARLLEVDRNGRVLPRALLQRLPGQEDKPFDGSGWLRDVQLDDEARADSSIVRSKFFKGDENIDVASSQSYVVAFRTRRNLNTELFALDLASLDVSSAIKIGVVPARRDLRDHPDCRRVSPRSGRVLPGANGGVIFGYGRQALIELTTPRSAEFLFCPEQDGLPIGPCEGDSPMETFPALSDTDIYSADLATAGSLEPVSTTPPPPSLGRRVFCPDRELNTGIPDGMNAADDKLINR